MTIGVDIDYLQAVQRAGGAPVILPCVADDAALRATLGAVGGVLLSGGGDILSLAYGEEPHEQSTLQDTVRDSMEFAVARLAIEMGLPILGICRGLQVLNVVYGGTLIQDIPSQVPAAIKHYSTGLDAVLLHTVEIEAGSLLARVVGQTTMPVNSWHHQAVNALGAGLRVNARARDGVVEGIEDANGAPVLAVQCHPEECAERHPCFQTLFTWLVEEAVAVQAKKRLCPVSV